MILKIFETKSIKILLMLFFMCIFGFGRSFMGIYIFNYRIGELIMGFSLLLFLISLISFNKVSVFQDILNRKIYITLLFIVFSFFILSFISDSSLLNPYTYKASSYIWSLGFLFLSIVFFDKVELKEKYLNVFLLILVYVYFFSIYGLPNNIVNFILSISDKYEPHKGSDILIMFVSVFFIYNRLLKNKRRALEIFSIYFFIFLPLVFFKSRGAAIAFLIFAIGESYYLRHSFKSTWKRNSILIFILALLLMQSIVLVGGSGFLKFEQTKEDVEYIAAYRADPDIEKFRLLFYEEDFWRNEMRLYSSDNNLNWRLQIWQDVFYDIHYKNLYLTGYGYKDIIPAMEQIDRQGLDRLNEHIHNYPFTLYARGGLLHFLSYLGFFLYLTNRSKELVKSNYLLLYIIPVMFTAFFDAAMENSHYPLIFYFIIGISFHKKKIFSYY